MPSPIDAPVSLFVYGTLRAAFSGQMALWLRRTATLVGPATIDGRLYQVADYPGLVPGVGGLVHGDLFTLTDAVATLAVLDDYEECAAHHPPPQEYRRERRVVESGAGPVEAWVYAYALDTTGLALIDGGDFLACARHAGD
jgi:gamma-glutamylcyclotransferase (GGCT)/AIG2-like uncharacterized protein YtfP